MLVLHAFISTYTPTPTPTPKQCMQAAEGLNYLHSMKPPVLHRDLRASNILVTQEGKAKVTKSTHHIHTHTRSHNCMHLCVFIINNLTIL